MVHFKLFFDPKKSQQSPVIPEISRKIDYDEKGNEYVSFVPVDTKEIQKSLGSVDNWSIEALTKAGIDPKFGIHTANPTRAEGLGALNDAVATLDAILENKE